MGIDFSRFGKFSVIILLNILCIPFACTSSLNFLNVCDGACPLNPRSCLHTMKHSSRIVFAMVAGDTILS
jgi:hypothetical protein